MVDSNQDAPAAPAERPRSGQPLSRDDVKKLLQVAGSLVASQASQSQLVRKLFERASVLGTFTLQQLTQGLEPLTHVREAAEEVLRDSVVVPQDGKRQWLLSPSSRRNVLAQLGDRAQTLLSEVTVGPTDPLGKAMAALIRGAAAPVKDLSTQELRSFTAAGEWLRDWSRLARERMAEWRAELQRRDLIEPLRLVADGFVGRVKDLEALRTFVDVAPPESRFEGWSRWLRGLWSGPKPPMLVHGIGGIGKSTLMAHFIVTHAAVTSERGFPFAYLDFDRASLDPANPGALLTEMLDQVSAQFPGIAAHREDWIRRLQSEQRRGRVDQLSRSNASYFDSSAADSATSYTVTDLFRSWLGQQGLGDRPFLLVLDTFEEVQMRGASAVDSVFELIEGLSGLPMLRVVIAGRAPIEDQKVTTYTLKNFDKKAALAFMKAQKLRPGISEAVWDKVGGNPLALRLAVKLVHQQAFHTVRKEDLEGWFGKKEGLYIQGYLYTRLLAHIGDKRIEKLAHPGLVLRRITPEILDEVLLPELRKLPGDELEGASGVELYNALKSEVSLVAQEGGALVHRKDVRAVMLEMQREDERPLFTTLNQAAADYYARHDPESMLSRRERAYHLLMLDGSNPLGSVEALDRDDLLALASAAEELPARARAIVRALLGQGLTVKERQTLPPAAWATYAYRRGLALLAAGTPEEAVSLLRERGSVVEQGPARYPLALALFNLLDWNQAEALLVEPIDTSSVASIARPGSREAVEIRLRPMLEAGFLAWYRDDSAHAAFCFSKTATLADDGDSLFLEIESCLGMVLVTEKGGRWNAQLNYLLRNVRPADWRQNLLTLRRVVFLGAAPSFLMRAAVVQLGVQLRNPSILALLLSTFRSRLSSDVVRLVEETLDSGPQLFDVEVLVSLERAVGTELAKLATGEEPVDAIPFLRGRFAPWKIPVRSALLQAYPTADDLIEAYQQVFDVPLHRLADARTPRAAADAIIEHSDQLGTLLPMAKVMLERARGSRDMPVGTVQLLHAMDRYARMGTPLDSNLPPTASSLA